MKTAQRITSTIFISILCGFISAPCFAHAKANGQKVSTQELLKILSLHQEWQSVAVQNSALPGMAAQQTTQEAKKWRFVGSDQAGVLTEKTRLSIGVNCNEIRTNPNEPDLSKLLYWKSENIDLNQPISIYAVHFDIEKSVQNCTNPVPSPSATITKLGNDRFYITFLGSPTQVLFFPSAKSDVSGTFISKSAKQAWTAPFGSLKEIVTAIYQLPPVADTAYLHHDLFEKKPVILDRSFPAEFKPAVEKALATWNKAFGANFFYLVQGTTSIDPLDCYSASKLCVRWTGSSHLAWAGLTCFGTSTFDPESGKIIGGIIDCKNDVPSVELTPTPAPLAERYLSHSLNVSEIASVYLRRDEFLKIAHPDSVSALTYFFTHEIGHFNGMGHNLFGSNVDANELKSASVMDYLPFPAISESAGNLGTLDFDTLNLVYRGLELPSEYRFCSDGESETLFGRILHKNRIADCNKFDLGEPIEWFIELTKQGPMGVFTLDPYSKEPILNSFELFLNAKSNSSDREREEIEKFLCSQVTSVEEIREHLKKTINFDLVCSTKRFGLSR